MEELRTRRLVLRAVDTDEAQRVVAGRPGPLDRWAEDFPFEGDVFGATMFLRATAAHGHLGPFGIYLVIRSDDDRAIGGIGFKGRPEAGSVEIGYGLVPSARGQGYAAEAVEALVALTRDLEVSRVVALTVPDNIASQRTLERAGFTRTSMQGGEYLYELEP